MYYKGNIIKVQELEENVTIIDDRYGASRVSDAMIDDHEYEIFRDLAKENIDEVITYGNLYNLIRKYKSYFVCHVNFQKEIIFKIITDKTGKAFGKEIITGLIFPLGINNGGYIVKYGRLPNNMRTVFDSDHIYVKIDKNVYLSDALNKSISPKYFPDDSSFSCFYIKIRVKKSNEVMDFIDNYIDKRGMKEASDIEVREYQWKHSLFKKKMFYNRLNDLYNANSFKRKIEIEEIKEEPHKELASQDKLTMIMENIEYCLSKMKMVNTKLYSEYQKKYEELLKGEETVIHLIPYDYKSFIVLESEIELTLKALKKNTSNIMDYLTALKKEYLYNLLNKQNTKTDITIKEIDKINELFLKSKDNYTILGQRNILKEFAIIYLLELLENRDFEIYSLKNSYINMHLKTIMMYVNSFIEIGIIKSNILVDLEDELSLQNVLEIIMGLEINQNIEKERVMELIR